MSVFEHGSRIKWPSLMVLAAFVLHASFFPGTPRHASAVTKHRDNALPAQQNPPGSWLADLDEQHFDFQSVAVGVDGCCGLPQQGLSHGSTTNWSHGQIQIYKDHLARDFDNFDGIANDGKGVMTKWGPAITLPFRTCFESVEHAVGGKNVFSQWPAKVLYKASDLDTPEKWAALKQTIRRGDVVDYGGGFHFNIALSDGGREMWGANNELSTVDGEMYLRKYGTCDMAACYERMKALYPERDYLEIYHHP